MTFKTFLAEAVILEGGAAIKGSHALTQAEARECLTQAMHDLKLALKLHSTQITSVGSAGAKPSDQLSGDIDVAVEADIIAVKSAVERLALDGRFRHMPGLNVYSYALLHGSKVAQVDVIPTTSIKLAKWAYHNDPVDLKAGLKGSHRNELLFAIAKHAELKSLKKAPDGTDSARERLVFDLSRGLFRYTQDRAGKRGLKKSFDNVSKALVASDPDKICDILLGVRAAQALTFHDVLKVMLSKSFKHKDKLKQIIDRAISGLEGKKLVVPHELRVAIISEGFDSRREDLFQLQQELIDRLPKSYDVNIETLTLSRKQASPDFQIGVGIPTLYVTVRRENYKVAVGIATPTKANGCFYIWSDDLFIWPFGAARNAATLDFLANKVKEELSSENGRNKMLEGFDAQREETLKLQQDLIDRLPADYDVDVEVLTLPHGAKSEAGTSKLSVTVEREDRKVAIGITSSPKRDKLYYIWNHELFIGPFGVPDDALALDMLADDIKDELDRKNDHLNDMTLEGFDDARAEAFELQSELEELIKQDIEIEQRNDFIILKLKSDKERYELSVTKNKLFHPITLARKHRSHEDIVAEFEDAKQCVAWFETWFQQRQWPADDARDGFSVLDTLNNTTRTPNRS